MNVVDLIKQFFHALLIFLIQVLVFRTTSLFGVASCFIYLGFIIQLPFSFPPISVLLITFCYTLTVDMFFDTPGIHTASALLIMYLRPNIIRFLTPQGGYETIENVSVFTMGIQWHSVYAFIIIFVHTFIVFSIESLSYFNLSIMLLKVLSTTVLTLFTVLLYQFLFLYKHTSR
ncbi:MAG: hypothetical protein H7259_07315 [Cytophagales bacterium]|nr:hypothetical protein [Cytophaga sp.]